MIGHPSWTRVGGTLEGIVVACIEAAAVSANQALVVLQATRGKKDWTLLRHCAQELEDVAIALQRAIDMREGAK